VVWKTQNITPRVIRIHLRATPIETPPFIIDSVCDVSCEVLPKKQSLMFRRLLGGGRVLGDSLGALRDGVLGELTGEDEADRGLDLARGDGGLLVVGGELGGLSCDALEDV